MADELINIDNTNINVDDIDFWTNKEDDTVNAIIEFNGKKSRLRAGLIIVKNGSEILLGEEEDEPGVFSLPGGGIEQGETPADAAKREAQEEVRITAKNVRATGHDYCECYDELKDWVKDNVPEKYQWYNYYTCLCIGEYSEEYDGRIDQADKDPHMLHASKFYKIKDVLNDKSFKLQWKKALYDAGYIKRKPIKELSTTATSKGKDAYDGKSSLGEDYDPPYNADQIKASYGLDTYKKLARDPARKWRMETGLELIHETPTLTDLSRIWANWQRMTDEQKAKSDAKSMELFGRTNAENYAKLVPQYAAAENKLNESKISDLTWYHGSTKKNITEFNQPINWFTTNLDYAKKFSLGMYVYRCKLQPKKILRLGDTDTPLYELWPLTKPFTLKPICRAIIEKFNLDEDEFRQELLNLAKEYNYEQDGYKMKLFTLVRSTYFANIIKQAGYDAIETTEYGARCLGMLDADEITIMDDRLTEDTRTQLVSKSRNAGKYKDTSRGKNRFDRKKYSKVANQVKSYNQIDMNAFFKQDTLEVKIPVTGETADYIVTVKMEGVVVEIRRNIKNNSNKLEYRTIIQALTKVFNTSNIYVKCTCDDFKYRFDHWSIVNNYGVDDTAHDPGPGKGVANPQNDKGIGCKHILLVLANGDWLMKVASVINNYINYASEHMQKAFLKLIFPKLYGIAAEDMIDDGLVDDPKYLDSSVGLIDAINAYGRNRGKYKAGTNKNPVTGTGGKQRTALKQPTKPAEEEPAEPKANK